MSMTLAELDAIRARCDAISPAPWQTVRNNFIKADWIPEDSRIVWCPGADVAYVAPVGPDDGNADAAFIAHARQDVPRLLAEVERLRARLAGQGIDPES
jgi:hypothetical protein